MTGPAPGKIRVPGARVTLATLGGSEELEAQVYIHLKGYSRARVTHIDIEDQRLNRLLPPRRSMYARANGIIGGIRLDFSRYVKGLLLEIRAEGLGAVLRPGETTIVYVGGKPGGIFLGFRKPFIPRLEEAARRLEAHGF